MISDVATSIITHHTTFPSIVKHNAAIFDAFIEFPKPILIAANGPAIGACVTSASLCDASTQNRVCLKKITPNGNLILAT